MEIIQWLISLVLMDNDQFFLFLIAAFEAFDFTEKISLKFFIYFTLSLKFRIQDDCIIGKKA